MDQNARAADYFLVFGYPGETLALVVHILRMVFFRSSGIIANFITFMLPLQSALYVDTIDIGDLCSIPQTSIDAFGVRATTNNWFSDLILPSQWTI